MTAYLIVRADVPEADRAAFDRWYQEEHLPDAKAIFDARTAWRGWAKDDPGTHLAFYEFADGDAARGVVDGEGIKGLIAEFDRVWQGRVTRTRDIVDVSQVL